MTSAAPPSIRRAAAPIAISMFAAPVEARLPLLAVTMTAAGFVAAAPTVPVKPIVNAEAGAVTLKTAEFETPMIFVKDTAPAMEALAPLVVAVRVALSPVGPWMVQVKTVLSVTVVWEHVSAEPGAG